MLRDGGCHWLTAMRSILQRKSVKPWLTVCPHIMCVCVHVFPAQTCVSMHAYVHYACVRMCYGVPLSLCWNSNLFTPQNSWCGPFTFWNEKQIQIQGQFPRLIICRHFQIKINFRSPCCSPLGLKYFPFECVWWKVFSAQPQRGGVLRGRQLCAWVCVCVQVCVHVS